MRVNLVFSKILNLLWLIFHAFGQISLLSMAKYWINNTAIWSHCYLPNGVLFVTSDEFRRNPSVIWMSLKTALLNLKASMRIFTRNFSQNVFTANLQKNLEALKVLLTLFKKGQPKGPSFDYFLSFQTTF